MKSNEPKHKDDAISNEQQKVFDENLYLQLRKLAHGLMHKERSGHTMSPTELVHNAYLKMSNYTAGFTDEQHYFRTMARQMRRLLVDYARHKSSNKQKGALQKVALTDSLGLIQEQPNFIYINDAIEALNEIDTRSAEVIEWVYFTGAEVQKVADLLAVSNSTVKRDLKFGRAFISDYVSNTHRNK
ncbi:ECF-type sigma factor [Marinicella rhabdoformis]|uniref:ECF-type sigma factor n=1 Tax=Marinicella rhabdoformis TaxID=2580566 RepID=UPI0012AEC806|nr:ECF-type sigma factor [Marinicella rhabdoformis]